ncbi:hypothetical protein AOLI_G00026210 [Acnodon oligacanthus]
MLKVMMNFPQSRAANFTGGTGKRGEPLLKAEPSGPGEPGELREENVALFRPGSRSGGASTPIHSGRRAASSALELL